MKNNASNLKQQNTNKKKGTTAMKTKRIISAMLALITIVSLFATASISASAATANADVVEISKITLQNVKTNEYMNFDYGRLSNSTPVRLWPRDGSPEQSWTIKRVSGNVYRILTGTSSKYCLDVYRGSSKLKAGQLIDIWAAGADSYAQNLTFYICDDGSFILRMAEEPGLAIGSTGSKARLQLVKFNANDSAQKWIARDANGNKIDITSKGQEPSSVSGIPTSAYKKTGVSYIVDGITYYAAKTTRAYNGVAKDTLFYIKSNGAVATDASVLGKIDTLVIFNQIRTNCRDSARLWASAATDYSNIAANIAAEEKLGDVIGKGCGMLLNLYAGNPIGIADACLTVAEETLSPETAKTAILLGLVRVYANDATAYGNQAVRLMSQPVYNYSTMLQCVDLYAKTSANFAALDYLCGDEVEEKANSTILKELGKYFKNVILGFADSVVPPIKAAEIAKYATDGVVSLTEFATKSGASSVYSAKLKEQSKLAATAPSSSAKAIADKLAKPETSKFVYPLKSSKPTNIVTQKFGAYYSPYGYHIGVDLATKDSASSSVLAIADGTVYKIVLNNKWKGWGNLVIVRHITSDGKVFYSGYGHLKDNSVCVKEGDKVSASQKIAMVGNTGISTGPHLHLLVYSGGNITKSTCPQGYSNTRFTGTTYKYSGITYYDPIKVIESSGSIIK